MNSLSDIHRYLINKGYKSRVIAYRTTEKRKGYILIKVLDEVTIGKVHADIRDKVPSHIEIKFGTMGLIDKLMSRGYTSKMEVR